MRFLRRETVSLRALSSRRMRLLICSSRWMLARFLFSLRSVRLIAFVKVFGIEAVVIGQLHFPPIAAHPHGPWTVKRPVILAFRLPLLL